MNRRFQHPFIDRLATRRLHLKWTYADIAERAGISEATVNRALNGLSAPSFTTIEAIALAMGWQLTMGAADHVAPVTVDAGSEEYIGCPA